MFGEAKFRCIYILCSIKVAHQTHLGNSILEEERVIFTGIIFHRKIKSILWNAWAGNINKPSGSEARDLGGRNKRKALGCHCSLA